MDENKPKGIELIKAIVKGTKIISATDDWETCHIIEDYAELDIEMLIHEIDHLKEPVILLAGWQTLKDYATAKKLSIQTVANWIYRNNGKIEFIRVKELNNLLLVRDKK